MATGPETIRCYLAAWNEMDPDLIRGHLDATVTDNVEWVDPGNQLAGIEALDALIRRQRAERPSQQVRLASGIDGHHGRFRYRWELLIGGQPVMQGMDHVTADDSSRLLRIDGFFGDFAPPA